MVCFTSFLVRLKEFQLKPSVHNTPNTPNGEGQAKSNTQPTKDPVEIPIEGVFCWLFNENPHEAWVSEGNWKSESS